MNVFVDGKSGTTGLRIWSRLEANKQVNILTLPEEARRDPARRRWALNSCDMAFLCLPDAAAKESVAMIENENVVVLDTSTAHRTNPDWAYGFPELSADYRSAVMHSKRIAVPGCHASGFIVLIQPLLEAGLLSPETALSCFSVTGYSGGGKNMIADYEGEGRPSALDAPRQYGLSQGHKHLPEMVKITGITQPPIFSPIVSDFYSGMMVTVPLFRSQLNKGADADTIREIYQQKYCGPVVRYTPQADESGFLTANALTGKDSMEVTVQGNDERILLISRYDNLGKGASGAALQCMNLAAGFEETTGLEL